jgi:thiamine-phosphate pyrophosphorylase
MAFETTYLRSYLVVGTQDVADVIAEVKLAVEAGVTMVALRDHDRSVTPAEFLQLAKDLRTVTSRANVPLVIYNELDVAEAVGADGVHLEDRTLAEEVAPAAAAKDLFVGVSINNRTELPTEVPEGVAYFSVGPVYPQNGDARPITHLAGLTTIVQNSPRPVVANGGITVATLKDVVRMGVYGVQASGLFFNKKAVQAANDTFAGMTVEQALGNTQYGYAIPGHNTNAVQGELGVTHHELLEATDDYE